MFAYNEYLIELLLAYFISVNGEKISIYGSFNCATTETT
jgi:rRNA processing protein Krr1/Pno1